MKISFCAGAGKQIINLDLVRRIYTEDVAFAEFPYKLVFVYGKGADLQKIGFVDKELRDKYAEKIEDMWNVADLESMLEGRNFSEFE